MQIKAHSFILTVLALCFVLAACNNDEKQIRKAAQGYLDATGNYLIDEALPYATKNTRETALPYMRDVLIPMTDTNYINANKPATINIDSVIIVQDTAWVSYTKTTPIKTSKNTICLLKEDGKWLVDIPIAIPSSLPTSLNSHSQDTTEYELKRILPDSTEQVITLRIPPSGSPSVAAN